eukprot:UN06570
MNRPFILCGSEQGAILLRRLLKDRLYVGSEHLPKCVAVYLTGIRLTEDFIQTNTGLVTTGRPGEDTLWNRVLNWNCATTEGGVYAWQARTFEKTARGLRCCADLSKIYNNIPSHKRCITFRYGSEGQVIGIKWDRTDKIIFPPHFQTRKSIIFSADPFDLTFCDNLQDTKK